MRRRSPDDAPLRPLYGEYANEIRNLLTRCKPETMLVVDLTEITFVDSIGEELLLAPGCE